MYAIVKTGGKQYKVAVGDVVEVEKVLGGPGDAVALPALLVAQGGIEGRPRQISPVRLQLGQFGPALP